MAITVNSLKVKPTTKNQWFRESMIWGHGSLLARITPAGERLFYFEYTSSTKKRVSIPIGTFGNKAGLISLAEARQKAMHYASLHKEGYLDLKEYLEQEDKIQSLSRETAIAEKEAQKEAIEAQVTVNKLFEHWARVDLVNRKDKGAEVRRMFEKDVLPIIGDIFVADVKKGNLTQVTDLLLARQVNRSAKLVFSLMRQMLRFAVDRDIIEHDPSSSIRKANIGGKTVERDRVLNSDEIKLLSVKLPKANLTLSSQYAVWICLATCCRIGELITAKWEHIDLEKNTWVIPAENSKNGKMHEIYLSEFSKQQFLQLKAITGSVLFCFPNRVGDSHLNNKTVTKQISDRQKESGSDAFAGRSKQIDSLVALRI